MTHQFKIPLSNHNMLYFVFDKLPITAIDYELIQGYVKEFFDVLVEESKKETTGGVGFSDGDFTASLRDEDGGIATVITATGILIDDIWQDMAVVRSGNTVSIYCDGVFQTSGDVSGINNTANFQFP